MMADEFIHFQTLLGTDYYINPSSIVYISSSTDNEDVSYIKLNTASTSIKVKGNAKDILKSINVSIREIEKVSNYGEEEIQGKSYN